VFSTSILPPSGPDRRLRSSEGQKVRVLKWAKDEAKADGRDGKLKDTRTLLTAGELQKAIKLSVEVNEHTIEERRKIKTSLEAKIGEVDRTGAE
jgi:hypothetical protein